MLETYGLWALIHDVVHPMELDEITKAIGRKRLDDNQLLWREIHALKEIYKEVHMINTNFNTLNLSSNSSSSTSTNSKNSKVPSLSSSKPRAFNNNNNNNGNRNSKNKKKQEEFFAEDLFEEIRYSLTVSEISMVLSKILSGLEQESSELEQEIRLLQGNVHEEVELISPINSQRSDCSAGNNNASNANHNNSNNNNNSVDDELVISSTRHNNKNNNNKIDDKLEIDGYISVDNLNRRNKNEDYRDRTRTDKGRHCTSSKSNNKTAIIKAPGAPRINTTPCLFNTDHQKQEEQRQIQPSRSRHRSKVRSHLQEARDMKHWLEDDDGFI